MFSNRLKVVLVSFFLVFALSECITVGKAHTPKQQDSTQLSEQRQKLVEVAKELVGTPYRYGGTDKRGFDCSGFTSFVFNKVNVNLSRTSGSQALEGRKVPLKKARTGDLVFFKRSKMSKVFHVAIILENGKDGLKVIHSTSRGVVIDNITDSKYWEPKIWVVRDVLAK